MNARLATAAALLLAFGGALALAAQGWRWAWGALILAALAAGMFEWGRLLGLGRVWRVAYASPFSLGAGFLVWLETYLYPAKDFLGAFDFLSAFLFLVLMGQSFFFWVAWLIMLLPASTMFFSRSPDLRHSARNVWLLGGLWMLPPVAWPMMLMPWPLTLFLMLMVAATDTAAFLVGKRFGRRLLAPRISPGKTWVGVGAGLAAAGAAGACLPLLSALADAPRVHWDRMGSVDGLLLGLVIGACVVAGDLAVSALKRFAGVKDSGRLLPGHGGVLDRIDGFLLAAPVFAIIFADSWYW